MSKIKINVYTNMNGIISNNNYNAIKLNNTLKFVDSNKSIFNILLDKKIFIKENNESLIMLDYNINSIFIKVKELNIELRKDIKYELFNISDNYINIIYILLDEKEKNEIRIEII